MAAIDLLLGQPLAEAVGWALVHSLWQVALVGVVASGTLGVLRRSAADIRYHVSAIALAILALTGTGALQGTTGVDMVTVAARARRLSEPASPPRADQDPSQAAEAALGDVAEQVEASASIRSTGESRLVSADGLNRFELRRSSPPPRESAGRTSRGGP